MHDRPDHGEPMTSGFLTSLASHGQRRTRSAAPWSVRWTAFWESTLNLTRMPSGAAFRAAVFCVDRLDCQWVAGERSEQEYRCSLFLRKALIGVTDFLWNSGGS